MRRLAALAGLLLLSTPAVRAAAPLDLRFTSAPKEVPKARKALDRWLKALAKQEFPEKARAVAMNQAIWRAQLGVQDMRDAVAELPAHTGDASAMAKTPRRKPAPEADCASLEDCPARIAAAHADDASGLADAVASVVRPWVLLQHRRRGTVSLRADADGAGTLATMALDGLVAAPVDICVSPAPMGGLDVWLRSAADLDDIYAFSREEALHPSRSQ